LAKKTLLDEVIDDMNTEIEEDLKSVDLKKAFRELLVTKRNEKKKEVKVDDSDSDNDSTTEED
jgi:hypothetical protein